MIILTNRSGCFVYKLGFFLRATEGYYLSIVAAAMKFMISVCLRLPYVWPLYMLIDIGFGSGCLCVTMGCAECWLHVGGELICLLLGLIDVIVCLMLGLWPYDCPMFLWSLYSLRALHYHLGVYVAWLLWEKDIMGCLLMGCGMLVIHDHAAVLFVLAMTGLFSMGCIQFAFSNMWVTYCVMVM